MKLSYLIILFFLANISFGQTIEEIKSDKDAITFIANNIPELHNFKYLESITNNAIPSIDSLKRRKWYTTDFDKNGKLDLLITGTNDGLRNMVYAVLADSDSTYTLKDLTPGGYFLTSISLTQKTDDDNIIVLHKAVHSIQWSDTLFYKCGEFLKYFSLVQKKKIALLKYSSTECFGPCPVYNVTIDSLSNSILEAVKLDGIYSNNSDQLEGFYHNKLSPEKFDLITELINYLYVSCVYNSYHTNSTDLPTGIIQITFTDGSNKRIQDYGENGTPGLAILHRYFYNLRFSEPWKK